MYSVNDIRFFTVCVSTFRNPRIEAYLQLPVAYRSLSRLSSAPDAKAFSLCSCLLELLLINIFDISPWFSIQELLSTLKNSVFRFVYLAIFTITCAAEIVFLPLINFNFFGKTNLISNFVFFPVNSSSLVNLSVSSCSH